MGVQEKLIIQKKPQQKRCQEAVVIPTQGQGKLFSGRLYFGSNIVTYFICITHIIVPYLLENLLKYLYYRNILNVLQYQDQAIILPNSIPQYPPELSPQIYSDESDREKSIIIEVLYPLIIFSYKHAVSLLSFDVLDVFKEKTCFLTGETMRIRIKIASL